MDKWWTDIDNCSFYCFTQVLSLIVILFIEISLCNAKFGNALVITSVRLSLPQIYQILSISGLSYDYSSTIMLIMSHFLLVAPNWISS